MIKETSEDLLLYMTYRNEDDPSDAKNAFSEFYRRFCPFLHKLVCNICYKSSLHHDKHFIQTVTNNTFHKVYLKAETFKEGDAKGDKKRLEIRIKAWLSRIAKNEFLAQLKEIPKELSLCDVDEDFDVPDYVNEEEGEISFEKELLDKALAGLNTKDREILLTYKRFEQGNKNLPTEEMKRLTQLFDTTSDNIRQRKSRALKQIKKYIAEHYTK